jgi:hypothetical protein
MASEITVNALLYFLKSGITDSFTFPSTQFTMTGANYIHRTQTIATTPGTAIDVASLATPGWGLFKNNGPTNFVQLKTATGGAVFAKLKVGEIALLRLDPTVTAPFAIADTTAIQLEYILIED